MEQVKLDRKEYLDPILTTIESSGVFNITFQS